MPVANEPIPQRLGPYVLGKRLGGGGMGDVYEAAHSLMSSRRVAIKLLKPELADKPQLVQRSLREISALGGVKAHPNLVRAEFADLADNVPYLVMEYVEGVDLNELLRWQGPFSVADACNCICQAAQGLEAIHQAGLVHRDLKPSNLMVTDDGVVKILDLGLARLAEGLGDELTSANCILGTMDYTAPEQAEDPHGGHPGRHLQPGLHHVHVQVADRPGALSGMHHGCPEDPGACQRPVSQPARNDAVGIAVNPEQDGGENRCGPFRGSRAVDGGAASSRPGMHAQADAAGGS